MKKRIRREKEKLQNVIFESETRLFVFHHRSKYVKNRYTGTHKNNVI